MAVFIAALILLIPLSSPFGEATATATSVDDGLRLEVSVEVDASPVAVVVRGIGAGASELPPVALSDRGDGRWEGVVEVRVVENILLGFEIIPTQGPATLSELHTLTDLGVDSAIFSMDNPDTGFGDDADRSLVTPEGARWGWLGLAAGAAALTLIAFWTVGTVRSRGDGAEEPLDDDEPGLQDDDPAD